MHFGSFKVHFLHFYTFCHGVERYRCSFLSNSTTGGWWHLNWGGRPRGNGCSVIEWNGIKYIKHMVSMCLMPFHLRRSSHLMSRPPLSSLHCCVLFLCVANMGGFVWVLCLNCSLIGPQGQ